MCGLLFGTVTLTYEADLCHVQPHEGPIGALSPGLVDLGDAQVFYVDRLGTQYF